MNTFHLRIVITDRVVYDGECEAFIFPAADGSMGILANHEPMAAVVQFGTCMYRTPDKEEHHIVISDGFLRFENNEADVLAFTCERPENIDINRAKRSLELAKEQLTRKQSRVEYNMTSARMARAMARLSGAKGVLSEHFTENANRKR